MMEFCANPQIGLLYNGKKICNGVPRIIGVYTAPGKAYPEFVEIEIRIPELPTEVVFVETKKLTFKELRKHVPFLHCTKDHSLFDEYLNIELIRSLKCIQQGDKSIKFGHYFCENGLHYLPDKRLCVVEGGDVIGVDNDCFIVNDNLRKIKVLQEGFSSEELLQVLQTAPEEALMVISFVMLTLVRSAVLRAGIDLQAVLYLVGPQGVGKAYLAQQIAGFVTQVDDPIHRPHLFYDASSTPAAIRDAMAIYRDLPLILDDLCLSASRATERTRRDLAAKTVRQAANAADIVKKLPGGAQLSIQCSAGVILTAEFALENPSDLTRCILLPLSKQLDLPAALSPEFVARVAKAFVSLFVKHREQLLQNLNEMVHSEKVPYSLDGCDSPRVRTNLQALAWAFEILLRMTGAEANTRAHIRLSFDHAIMRSVDALNEELRKLATDVPEGNLAFVKGLSK